MESLASKKVAAEVVGDGEGEAVHTIIGFKLAFEISAPDIVRGQDRTGGFAGMPDPASPAANGDHVIALKDIADRGSAGQLPTGVSILNDLENLFTARGRMHATQCQELGYDFRIGFVGGVMWFSREVLEGARSLIEISFEPFVAGLARNIVAFAKFREREPLFRSIGDELNFLVHR